MPSLASLRTLIPTVVPPIVQGIVGTRGTSNAVQNLTQGATQATTTLTDAQKKAQDILDAQRAKNAGLLQPFQPGGAVSTTLTGTNAGLLKPFQYGGDAAAKTAGLNASLLEPYQTAGSSAVKQAGTMTTPGGGYDINQDPSYKWRLQQGLAAINAGAAASGNRFSGATLKALNDYAGGSASQEFQNEFGRQMQLAGLGESAASTGVSANLAGNAQQQAAATEGVNANLSAAGLEQNAAALGVGANNQYGTQTVNLTTGTSKAIADLQTEKASALAAGDVAKANQITSAISAMSQGLSNQQGMDALKGLINPAGPRALTPAESTFLGGGADISNLSSAAGAIPAAAALAGGGTAAGTGGTAAVGALAGIPGAGGALAAPEVAAPALAGGTGGSMAAIGSFLTNPITIGVGAALAGALIWKKSQVHPTADKFVKGFQDPFGQHLGEVINAWDQAVSTGQLKKGDAQQIYGQVKGLIDSFENDRKTFMAKGGKERTVGTQAGKTMATNFGGDANGNPDYSKILGGMQQQIAGMAA